MSNFDFLKPEWPDVHEAATAAEKSALGDPRVALFHSRRALELLVEWMYESDGSLYMPYQSNLSALIHEASFQNLVGEAIFTKARYLKDLGNRAVHGRGQIRTRDSVFAVKELHHICFWAARTYSRSGEPEITTFNDSLIPAPAESPQTTQRQIEELNSKLLQRSQKLVDALRDRAALTEELKQIRAQVAEVKAYNAGQPDTHDYNEQETRDRFIDLLLHEAGWPLDQQRDREYEVSGMPTNSGQGFVDYVLWGDDGKPLGLVEAKRTRRDPREGKRQAELYADCLEAEFGQRPIIFYSNGYQHYIWDDQQYSPRSVQGFYKKSELELLIQRRSSRERLATAEINQKIVDRYYQSRAIRNISETFEKDNLRKALLVMATGTGKTRTVVALSDLLMRCNWAKRILFLADRVALVRQAVNSFKQHLPDATVVNLVEDKETDGRVFVSTYPTMMGLIDETVENERRFGPGHFDLVIIDEAHRSVFRKYKSILDYFDSLLIGLTATPKEEIDRNTYQLFDLEVGVPTDAYPLDEAVQDGYLTPMKAIAVPTYFLQEGIKYADLSEEEKEQWDELEWDDEAGVPDSVSAQALNQWLFNRDTVDKVLAHVMEKGQKVAGGDRLGKTIIFAKNQRHADFIQERFDVNYPAEKGKFARTITYSTEHAQSLIDAFSMSDPPGPPHIAISVDMLDTGIDVPEVLNLLFFKPIRSKTKFWQMIGRGTRLCPNVFGPGQDKEFFYVFDVCGNLEFFGNSPSKEEGSTSKSLGQRLFEARVDLIAEIDQLQGGRGEVVPDSDKMEPDDIAAVRAAIAGGLHNEVSSMNLENFMVRPRRQLVEKFAQTGAWRSLSARDLHQLQNQIADLPTQTPSEEEEAKRFDLLVFRLQLSLLQSGDDFDGLRKRLVRIVNLIEEKDSIPLVKEQIPLIKDLQSADWWDSVSVPQLEKVRRRLRKLVRLIDRELKAPIYSDFEDIISEGVEVDLPGLSGSSGLGQFRLKARSYLREHMDDVAVYKLRMAIQLEPDDLAALELAMEEIGDGAAVAEAAQESNGLGLFLRSLIGIDRQAAADALSEFTAGTTLNSNQIDFVNLIIERLVEYGIAEPKHLYDQPFTDIAPEGPRALFSETEFERLRSLLERLQTTASAAT